jgi:tetratricopeptide (TPR) repeat protein
MTIEPDDLRKYIECDACGASNPPKRCSRCRCAFYCSVECQKKHWRESHKSDCVHYETMCAEVAEVAELDGTLPATTTPVNTACGICLEETMQQQVVLKGCKHAFCLACLKEWQAYTTHTANSFDTENPAMSCPLCRQEIEKSVVEDTVENARLYTARARKLQENDPERSKYFELALAEVDKLLLANEHDLGALGLKGQILQQYAPADAIKVYERTLELDREGSANLEKLEAMEDQVKVAMDAGDDDEADRLMSQTDAYCASGVFIGQIGSGPHRLFDLMMDFALAHETLGNWDEALEIYDDTMNRTLGGHQIRKIYAGISRCMYQLGFYDNAVTTGEAALAMNRRSPGVHKLIALPQLALGQVEAARTTMRRGVVYEVPWDDENRQQNIAFLEECLCGKTTEEGG